MGSGVVVVRDIVYNTQRHSSANHDPLPDTREWDGKTPSLTPESGTLTDGTQEETFNLIEGSEKAEEETQELRAHSWTTTTPRGDPTHSDNSETVECERLGVSPAVRLAVGSSLRFCPRSGGGAGCTTETLQRRTSGTGVEHERTLLGPKREAEENKSIQSITEQENSLNAAGERIRSPIAPSRVEGRTAAGAQLSRFRSGIAAGIDVSVHNKWNRVFVFTPTGQLKQLLEPRLEPQSGAN
ncbi:unnamed protein product [Boreogadus saida]